MLPEDSPELACQPLPRVSVYDVVALSLKKWPRIRYALTTAAVLLEGLCCSFNVLDPGVRLAALELIGPLCCLQCMSSTAVAERLNITWLRVRLPLFVVVIGMLCNIFLFMGSLWLVVAWDAATNDAAPKSAAVLQRHGSAALHGAWSVSLADAAVDVSHLEKSHRICRIGKGRQKVDCDYLHAAPVYAHAEEAGSPTSLWAVGHGSTEGRGWGAGGVKGI